MLSLFNTSYSLLLDCLLNTHWIFSFSPTCLLTSHSYFPFFFSLVHSGWFFQINSNSNQLQLILSLVVFKLLFNPFGNLLISITVFHFYNFYFFLFFANLIFLTFIIYILCFHHFQYFDFILSMRWFHHLKVLDSNPAFC